MARLSAVKERSAPANFSNRFGVLGDVGGDDEAIRMIMMRRVAALTLAAALVVAGTGPMAAPLPAAQAQLFGISERQEIQIGREVERQLARKPGFVNDPALTQQVTALGLKLAHVSERPNLPWTYHILNDTGVNAIAAPGGFIFVTRGLLGFVRSQDELAFVIGHETTHVAHRHAVDLAKKDMELQFGAVIVSQILLGGNFLAYQLAQVGRMMLDAKYSRDKEFEADHYGVIFAQKAGFDPTASILFFDRLRQQEKSNASLARAFEDHPETPARIAAICTELGQMGYRVACPVTPAPAAKQPPAPRPGAPAAPPMTVLPVSPLNPSPGGSDRN